MNNAEPVTEKYSDTYLQEILADVKTIGLVGASAKPHRDSYRVMRFLLDRGYTVFPVNPNHVGEKILGQTVYASLQDLPASVDMVDVFRNSDAALQVAQEAIAIDTKVLWMQLGVINQNAAELASNANLKVVMNRCPIIELTKLDHGIITMPEVDKNELVLKQLNDAGVLRLTLNDVARRNALSNQMLAELKTILDDCADNQKVRVIVIAANGPAFCAGHDLKEINQARENSDQGAANFTQLFEDCAEVMQAIVNNPKPVIAEVATVATAAGCQLVASCDLAVASESARFATPGVNIGLFCSTPMVALSRNVSNKHAMEMLLTGDMLSAPRAEAIGLINRVVEDQQLSAETMAMAEKIAAKSSMTLAVGKRAFYTQAEMNLADAYRYASEVMVNNLLKSDAKEGISAFIEKRAPNWMDE